jgi:hypothetical protein
LFIDADCSFNVAAHALLVGPQAIEREGSFKLDQVPR